MKYLNGRDNSLIHLQIQDLKGELEETEERLSNMVDSDAYATLEVLRDELQDKYDGMIHENQKFTKLIGK